MTGEQGYRIEFLPEVGPEANDLPLAVRKALAEIVVELHCNPYLGISMDQRWPQNLEGSRKVRFDSARYRGKPRYRLVYKNEPSDGAVGTVVVLAVGSRTRMEAYAKAAKRLLQREAARSRRGRRT
jgi:mRNA-degrading endonuclease RelE of RelBE toxin-antitoxin system